MPRSRVPVQAFLYVGDIDEARAKAKEMAKRDIPATICSGAQILEIQERPGRCRVFLLGLPSVAAEGGKWAWQLRWDTDGL